ncbi:MAG: hypothetical protein DRP35_06305, partial [Candidatus Zixiibacteriota bacterium]
MMNKIMMLTVGTGRSRDDIAKMLMFSIKNSNPDFVYFLVSQKTLEETIPAFEKETSNDIQFETVLLNDEND